MKKCSKCGKEKELTDYFKSYGQHRPSCKECDKASRDPYKQRVGIMASHLMKRLANTHLPKNKCYIGIECRIGSTVSEVREYLHKNFEKDIRTIMGNGDIPSLDRIDSGGHYEEGNLRVITFRENYLLGVANACKVTSKKVTMIAEDGSVREFDSISHASRELGIKRDTIIEKLKTCEPLSSQRIKDKSLLGSKFIYTVR